MKYKIIGIMGKSGSGKDTLMQSVLSKTTSLNEIISHTTRPRREHETDGVQYFFVSPEEFARKILDGEMLEVAEFNDWFYGTSYESLRSDCVNIGVFSPYGIETLLADNRVDLKIVYVIADDKERLLRQLNREEHPNIKEIIRRYGTDENDFSDLGYQPDLVLVNENSKDFETASELLLSLTSWDSWTK